MWNKDFDDAAGTVLPESMVDAAIEANKEYPHKRLIIHFMQPHGPFVGTDIPEEQINDQYWEAYDENLEYVLNSIRRLLDNISGKSVITGDHGQISPSPLRNILGVGGHKPGLRHPGLVRVPWAVVDGKRREVAAGATEEAATKDINDRLRDLGYKI
jgi:hypothetical protein